MSFKRQDINSSGADPPNDKTLYWNLISNSLNLKVSYNECFKPYNIKHCAFLIRVLTHP